MNMNIKLKILIKKYLTNNRSFCFDHTMHSVNYMGGLENNFTEKLKGYLVILITLLYDRGILITLFYDMNL